MQVSSRTPEGEPHHCSICGAIVVTEPAEPLGDSVCPRCGAILLRLKDSLQSKARLALHDLNLHALLSEELGLDSLATVELVMELEEEFDIRISDEDAEKIQTLADVMRFILKHIDHGEDEPAAG